MRKLAFHVIVMLVLAVPVLAASKEPSRDAWMGVYLGPTKIGYMHTTVTRDKLDGKDVYCMRETLVSRLRIEGKRVRRDSTTTLYFGDDLKPIRGVYEDDDNGVITRVEARFQPGRILCTSDSGGVTSARNVTIPSGADLSARLVYELGRKTLRVGDEVSAASFDSAMMSVITETLKAVRREDVTYQGKKRSATVVVHGTGRSEVTDWRLDSGDLVKSEIRGIGATMVAQSKDTAQALMEETGPDLDVVKADKPIANPRRVSQLDLRLIGVPDKALVISDSQQSAEYSEQTLTATYHIRRSANASATSAKMPAKASDLDQYRKPTEGIESRDGSIVSQARKIVSGEKNTLTAAGKLRLWVQTSVVPSDTTSTALSAVDVLKKRTGCCRHNAVLYAALARAAGIPTRLAGGLIYDSGSFRFHVWAESWVGGWVCLDPTYPGEFVDATHVKLVEGNLEDLPALGRVAGRLKAEIISAK